MFVYSCHLSHFICFRRFIRPHQTRFSKSPLIFRQIIVYYSTQNSNAHHEECCHHHHHSHKVQHKESELKEGSKLSFWKDKEVLSFFLWVWYDTFSLNILNQIWKRASTNTLRCLIGCSIGDLSTMFYLSTFYPSLPTWTVMGLSMTAGIGTSLALETIALRISERVTWKDSFKLAWAMSVVSMLVMEFSENIVDRFLTGGMVHLSGPILFSLFTNLKRKKQNWSLTPFLFCFCCCCFQFLSFGLH